MSLREIENPNPSLTVETLTGDKPPDSEIVAKATSTKFNQQSVFFFLF